MDNRAIMIYLKRILFVALAILVFLLVLLAVIIMGDRTPSGSIHHSTASTATGATDPLLGEDITIKTPYVVITYPCKWAEYLSVRTTQDGVYTVHFAAKLTSGKIQELYSIGFGGESATAMGFMTAESGEKVNIQMTMGHFQPDDSWTDVEKNTVYAMMETVNDVLRQLIPSESVDDPQLNLPADNGDITIDTRYVTLYFPQKWKDSLYYEIYEDRTYRAAFFCCVGTEEKVHLFTILFGSDEGIPVTDITDKNGTQVSVSIQLTEIIPNDAWSEEERSKILYMQEDVNFLIEKLG